MPNQPNERVLYRLDTILESIQFIEEICKENGNIVKALENRVSGRPAILVNHFDNKKQIYLQFKNML